MENMKMSYDMITAFRKAAAKEVTFGKKTPFAKWQPLSHNSSMTQATFTTDGPPPSKSDIELFEAHLRIVLGAAVKLTYVEVKPVESTAAINHNRRRLNVNVIPGIFDRAEAAAALGFGPKIDEEIRSSRIPAYTRDPKTHLGVFLKGPNRAATFGIMTGIKEWLRFIHHSQNFMLGEAKSHKFYIMNFISPYQDFLPTYDYFFESPADYDVLIIYYSGGKRKAMLAAAARAVADGKKVAIFACGPEDFNVCRAAAARVDSDVFVAKVYGPTICRDTKVETAAAADEDDKMRSPAKYDSKYFPEDLKKINEKAFYNTAKEIAGVACIIYGTTEDKIFSPSRLGSAVDAKRAMAIFLREYFQVSYAKLGEYFDRDHSTILNLIKSPYVKIFLDDPKYHEFKKRALAIMAKHV